MSVEGAGWLRERIWSFAPPLQGWEFFFLLTQDCVRQRELVLG
jgi:hypothetical protein